jgi:hypothetical protein
MGGVAIITAVAAYLVGDTTLADALQLVVTAVMGMFIRAGVKADTKVIK